LISNGQESLKFCYRVALNMGDKLFGVVDGSAPRGAKSQQPGAILHRKGMI
jgi:hypothetical protein